MPDSKDASGTARFQLLKDVPEVEIAPKQAKEDMTLAAPSAATSADSKLPRNIAANISGSRQPV